MLKKLKYFALLFFIVAFTLQSETHANMDERRQQLVNIIDEELKEVLRLNRQLKSRNPNLLLRMAELYLEKARIINEEENYRWLTLSSEEAAKTNQDEFYKESRKHYLMAQKTCYFILKKYKNFKGRGDVYYILAYNAKEFQQEKRAKEFFSRAIKYSKSGSYTALKSKLALGEMLYNEKKYKEAIPYYEAALKKKDEKWWTKDAYNLAWCYFRVNDKSQAINLMQEVHRLSGNASYIDVRDQVERDLAYFYSEAGRSDEALSFYKKIGKDISSNFLKVGKYLKGQGKFAAAEQAFAKAAQNTESEPIKVEVYVELLSLYEKFGKIEKHLSVCEYLYEASKKGLLSPENLEDLKYHVASMSSRLQKQVVSKAYRKKEDIKRERAGLATQYFKLQSGLSGTIDHRAIFHAAETQYAVKNYNKAANLYNHSYEVAKTAGDTKIAALALDGLMASLNGKGVTKETTEKYLSKAYAIFLEKNPRSKKSYKIYQRLFRDQFEKGDIAQAEKTLQEFKVHFPTSQKIQEAMLAKIMDHYREKKDRDGIKKWVDRINTGEFVVSKKFANQLRLILLSIQFDKVQKFNTKGEKVEALKGYLTIYKEPTSSEDARKNAAYNVAILFHELGNKEKTYGWAKRSLSMMNSNDVLQFEDSFLLMASGLFNYREFKKSADLYELVLDKVCSTAAKNKDTFFRNASVIYLADRNVDKSLEVLDLGSKCRIKNEYIYEAALDTLKELGDQEKWQSFEKLLTSLQRYAKYWPDLIYPLSQLRDTYLARGRKEQAIEANQRLNTYYRKSKAKGLKIPLEGLDIVAENYLVDLRNVSEKLASIRLSFPEKSYNNLLKAKFEYLDKVTSKALEVFKIGSGKGIVSGYQILVESYKDLANEIANFTPEGKSPEYVTSFKASMQEIAAPIAQKAREFEAEAVKQINNSKILAPNNYYFLGNRTLPVAPMFFPIKKGVLMDRGGRR